MKHTAYYNNIHVDREQHTVRHRNNILLTNLGPCQKLVSHYPEVYFACFSLLRLHRYKMPICLFNDNRSTNHKKKPKYHHMFIQWQSSDTSHEAMKWPDTAQRSLRGPQTVFSDAELNQNCVCCWEIAPLMHNSASSLIPWRQGGRPGGHRKLLSLSMMVRQSETAAAGATGAATYPTTRCHTLQTVFIFTPNPPYKDNSWSVAELDRQHAQTRHTFTQPFRLHFCPQACQSDDLWELLTVLQNGDSMCMCIM